MPRIRTVKPQFWSSPNPPSRDARLLYLALLNLADDEGVGSANPKELAAFAFPYDDDIGAAEIRTLLNECSLSYQFTVYEVAGRQYFAILNFLCHQVIQRPTKSKLPKPSKADRVIYPQAEANSLSPHGVLNEDSVSHRVSCIPTSLLPTSVGSNQPKEPKDGGTSPARAREADAEFLTADARFRAGRVAQSLTGEANELVPTNQPEHIRNRLRMVIGELLNDGAATDDIQRAVDRWLQRLADGEDIHPGHLRQCYSQVIAQATITPAQRRNGRTLSTGEKRALAALSLKSDNPPRKELPHGP